MFFSKSTNKHLIVFQKFEICYPHDKKHGDMQADIVVASSTSGSEGSRKRETLGLAWAFETLQSTLSDIFPPKGHTSMTKH